MDIMNIILSFIGLGTLLNSYFLFRLNKRKIQIESNHQHKEKRYRHIQMLTYALIYYDTPKNRLEMVNPMINTKEKLVDEIFTEWSTMLLYANDEVIFSMKKFIQDYNRNTFYELMISMRKDLYDVNTKITKQDFEEN